MGQRINKTRRLSRGMTMIELIAAAALLAALLASAVQVIRVLDTQQRFVARRTLALETAQSLLEQLANTPYAELTPTADTELTIPENVKSYLPDSVATASVIDEPSPVAAKRVTVELQWNAPSGVQAAPIRLTTWIYERD